MKTRIDAFLFGLVISATLIGLSACWAKAPLMGKAMPKVSGFAMQVVAVERNRAY